MNSVIITKPDATVSYRKVSDLAAFSCYFWRVATFGWLKPVLYMGRAVRSYGNNITQNVKTSTHFIEETCFKLLH